MNKELIEKNAQREYPINKEMMAWVMKNTANVVEFDKGELVRIDKPAIQTSFCFGYGQNGCSTEAEHKSAEEERKMSETFEYFFKNNLEKINGEISLVKKAIENENKIFEHNWDYGILAIVEWKVYPIGTFGCIKFLDHKLVNSTFTRETLVDAMLQNENVKSCRLPSMEELKRYLEGLEEVKKSFEKRLNTYWKKYGSSKLKTRTFLVD